MNIHVQNLRFAYGAQPVLAIKEVELHSGHIYGIVGKNGAGKTTFFKTLTNIITNYEGSVIYTDTPSAPHTAAPSSYGSVEVRTNPAVLTKVGIMLDDMALYKGYTGLFNLRYFGGLRGGFDESKALLLAKELEIDRALAMKPSQYSLGMEKKLILLISLINDAEVLIFDEPFRGIDASSVVWFRNYLLGLKAQGKLIIISSHVQEDIESLCDTVYLLQNGDLAASFDLTDRTQALTYTVAVNRPEDLIQFLTGAGVTVMTRGNLVKFDSTPEHFQQTFQHAVAHGIIFDEIKKESKFAEIMKEGR